MISTAISAIPEVDLHIERDDCFWSVLVWRGWAFCLIPSVDWYDHVGPRLF